MTKQPLIVDEFLIYTRRYEVGSIQLIFESDHLIFFCACGRSQLVVGGDVTALKRTCAIALLEKNVLNVAGFRSSLWRLYGRCMF